MGLRVNRVPIGSWIGAIPCKFRKNRGTAIKTAIRPNKNGSHFGLPRILLILFKFWLLR